MFFDGQADFYFEGTPQQARIMGFLFPLKDEDEDCFIDDSQNLSNLEKGKYGFRNVDAYAHKNPVFVGDYFYQDSVAIGVNDQFIQLLQMVTVLAVDAKYRIYYKETLENTDRSYEFVYKSASKRINASYEYGFQALPHDEEFDNPGDGFELEYEETDSNEEDEEDDERYRFWEKNVKEELTVENWELPFEFMMAHIKKYCPDSVNDPAFVELLYVLYERKLVKTEADWQKLFDFVDGKNTQAVAIILQAIHDLKSE